MIVSSLLRTLPGSSLSPELRIRLSTEVIKVLRLCVLNDDSMVVHQICIYNISALVNMLSLLLLLLFLHPNNENDNKTDTN